MDINGELSDDEAKQVAVMGDNAPAGQVLPAIKKLYLMVRALENARDGHLSSGHKPWCSCHDGVSGIPKPEGAAAEAAK